MKKTWTNWAKIERSTPVTTVAPRSLEQVQRTLDRACETGHTVKAIGASHSFSAIGATDGIRIDLGRLRGLVSADLDRARVTFWAGTHLWEISDILAPLGLALENMGDINRQTLSGATQTGTHGTGLNFGCLSSQIVGLTMVDGTGTVRAIDEFEPELLRAAALGLGALGVVITITLQCVPQFLLGAVETPARLESILDDYLDLVRTRDHFEFFWFPHTSVVRTKTNTRIDLPQQRAPLGKGARFIDEEVLNNAVFAAVLAVESALPGLTPRVNRLLSLVSSRRSYSDFSHEVFVTKRRVKFRESEFAIPIEAVAETVREIRSVIERRRLRISFPVEVRSSAATKMLLSPAHERRSGYVAVHCYIRDDHREYFAAVQSIMRAHDARPHWGKMHDFDANYLQSVYPRFEQFLQIRDDCDPNRVFANDYLTRVLGS